MRSKANQHASPCYSESAFGAASSFRATVLTKAAAHCYLIYSLDETTIAGATCRLLHEPVIKTGAESAELCRSAMGLCIYSSRETRPHAGSLKAPSAAPLGLEVCWRRLLTS